MLFQVFGTENYAYRDVLEDIFDLGNELNTIKNLYKISRVGFLIDSTLATTYNTTDNPFDDVLRNGTEIFQYQNMLRKLLVFILGTNKNYIVQFDEQKAWSESFIHSCT